MDKAANSLIGLMERRNQVNKEIENLSDDGIILHGSGDIKSSNWNDIITFLKKPIFLGHTWSVGPKHKELYYYWEEQLKDLFDEDGQLKYNDILLTGAIGVGKSSIISQAIAPYLLYNFIVNSHELLLKIDNELRSKKFIFLFYNPIRSFAEISRDNFIDSISKSMFFGGHFSLESKFWDYIEFKVASSLEEVSKINDIILYTFMDEASINVKGMEEIFDKLHEIQINTCKYLRSFNINLTPSIITAATRNDSGFAYEMKLLDYEASSELNKVKIIAPRIWDREKKANETFNPNDYIELDFKLGESPVVTDSGAVKVGIPKIILTEEEKDTLLETQPYLHVALNVPTTWFERYEESILNDISYTRTGTEMFLTQVAGMYDKHKPGIRYIAKTNTYCNGFDF